MSAISWPNRITLVRIAFIPAFVVMVMKVNADADAAWRYAAMGLFFVMALSDVVDGLLARLWAQKTVLGRYLDPLADKMLLTTACVLLACSLWPSPRLPQWLPVLVISREILIIAGSLVLFLINGRIKAEPTRVGKATTAAMMATVTATLLNNLFPLWFLTITWWAAGLLTVASGVQYTWLGTRQVNHDPASARGESR